MFPEPPVLKINEIIYYLFLLPEKEIPSLMKSVHLRQALYAGEIFTEHRTSVLATTEISSHHGQNTGRVFLSTPKIGIGIVSVVHTTVFFSMKPPMPDSSSRAFLQLFSSGILPVILANSANSPGFRPAAVANFFHASC